MTMEKNTKKGLRKKIRISGNIKFRERMLLIYIIGGIIPFVIALLYTSSQSKKLLLMQNQTAQQEEISLISTSLMESMRVAQDVSQQIYNDKNVQEILSRINHMDYQSDEDFEEDCRSLNYIDKYKEYYVQEISDIRIYVVNETSKNNYISYLDGGRLNEISWYLPTTYRDGKTYWSYDSSISETVPVIQLTRAIQGSEGELLGILAVQLRSANLTNRLAERDVNTVLYYEDRDVLLTNFNVADKYDFLKKHLKKSKTDNNCITIDHGVRDYLVTYEKIYPDDSSVHYTVVSVQDYQSLLASITQTGVFGMAVVVIGLLCSFGLIVVFSTIQSNRMARLQRQMHLVATGEYDKVEPIEGKDEVGLIYQELEEMAGDIRDLTVRVAQEEVLKEKLHTKQKEVEFKMLASQINPHFLYNTLETIRMKAKINHQSEIEELVKMLAKIMRRNIQVGDSMVTLRSEIELIQNYLFIQDFRFGDRIHSEVKVMPAVNTEMLVVPLIMQPFVENAYVHGLEAKEKDGLLRVTLDQADDTVIIQVWDNGVGIMPDRLDEMQTALRNGASVEQGHIGISNVNQRLKILYGEKYGVELDSIFGRWTAATIRFPADGQEGGHRFQKRVEARYW